MKLILTAAVAATCLCASFSPSMAEAGVILDTNFSDAALYPPDKALGIVADGQGTWTFNSLARAKELGDEKRGINMVETGFNVYTFNDTYTEGKITVEFSFIPHHAQNIFDIQLASINSNDHIGPQIRFGANGSNDVSYYYNDVFVTIPGVSFTRDEVNTFSFTAYLSGEKTGKFDLYLNGELVGESLMWRKNLESLTVLRMRIPTSSGARNTDLVGLKITYDAIPEPSSIALSITSLLFLGGISGYLSQRRES